VTEGASFGHGAAVYPLSEDPAQSLLEDADPALFRVLDFLSAMIEFHVGDRLRAHAHVIGLRTITPAVATKMSVEPSPYTVADNFRFPILAIWRTSETHLEHTAAYEKSVGEWAFAYVLPVLTPSQVTELSPVLRAASRVIAHYMSKGSHPSYMDGAHVFATAGIQRARFNSAKYGPLDSLGQVNGTYPAVTGTLEVTERDEFVAGDFEPFAGADVTTDEQTSSGAVSAVVELSTTPSPTVTNIVPNSGTKAGGTTVTVTGTYFGPGPLPRVFFGDVECLFVMRNSTTSLTCVTPAHDAFPTYMADVTVENAVGQSGTLSAGYTFTTP
jgi:hypothetical protein